MMRHSTLTSRTHEILRILLILFPVLGIEESYRCQMTSTQENWELLVILVE